MILVLMGVAGSGKTTIGRLLAEQLGQPFYDADDFHPPENIAGMSRGQPLGDAERHLWLQRLAQQFPAWQERGGAVLACSALKEDYRSLLRNAGGVPCRFICLHGTAALIEQRLRRRQSHFFPAGLLQSQFFDLELTEDLIMQEIEREPRQVCREICTRLVQLRIIDESRMAGHAEG